jgi:hypothetical protein
LCASSTDFLLQTCQSLAEAEIVQELCPRHGVLISTVQEAAMRRFIRLAVLFVLALSTAATAFAQSQPPNSGADQNAPSRFDAQAGQQRSQSLSERLDRSGGVIHPPGNVDADIQIPPPATGDKMPVMPAPGSPGGDPTIKPK